MYLCQKCKDTKSERMFYHILGDGLCDKHGRFSYSIRSLKVKCYQCALEKNICQMCGNKVKE